MRLPQRTRRSPIGLDLGTHSFKAVQLRRDGGAWCVDVSVSLPRQTPGTAIERVEIERFVGVLDRRGFTGRDVVVGVPAAGVLSTILELPARGPGVPLEQIAAVEFGRVHKLETATVSMSTWELPPPARASKATYMLAVGAKTDLLTAHVDLLESAGLGVVAVDEPYSAAARGCLHGVGVDSGMVAVVELGWEAATLAILKRDLVVYTRRLADAGLGRVFASVIEDAECDPAEVEQEIWTLGLTDPTADAAPAQAVDALNAHFTTLLREIGQAIGYTGHQYPDAAMNGVLLAGGGATIPGVEARFFESLGVQARAVATPNATPAMMQALGLSLWSEAPQ